MLDVTAMKLKNFRKDIEITDESLYQRCLHDDIISVDVCSLLFRDSSGLGVAFGDCYVRVNFEIGLIAVSDMV